MTTKLLFVIPAIIWVASAYSQYPPEFKNSIYGHNPKFGHYANVRGFKMYYDPTIDFMDIAKFRAFNFN